jgi:hypothetical protein
MQMLQVMIIVPVDNVTVLTIQKNAPKTIHLLFFLFLKTNRKYIVFVFSSSSTCNLLAYDESNYLMGRTISSFRLASVEEQKDWKEFRQVLDKSDRHKMTYTRITDILYKWH